MKRGKLQETGQKTEGNTKSEPVHGISIKGREDEIQTVKAKETSMDLSAYEDMVSGYIPVYERDVSG